MIENIFALIVLLFSSFCCFMVFRTDAKLGMSEQTPNRFERLFFGLLFIWSLLFFILNIFV